MTIFLLQENQFNTFLILFQKRILSSYTYASLYELKSISKFVKSSKAIVQ